MEEESVINLMNNLDNTKIGYHLTTVNVPITTNKLKNHCLSCLEKFQLFKRKNSNVQITLQTLYRATLAQLSYHLWKSTPSLSDPYCKYVIYNKKNRKRYSKYNDIVMGNDTNFFPLAQLINSVGSYTLDEINFQAYIPPASTDQHGNKIPDPFKVSIENLELFVNYLSRNDTDPESLEIRRYFHAHDPLPDARWSEDGQHRLLNGDEIFPKNYDLRKDLIILSNCSWAVSDNYAYLFGKCKFDGKGNAIQLINVTKDNHGVEATCSYHVRDEKVYHMAAAFMIGERPPNPIQGRKEIWDFRCSKHCNYRIDSYCDIHNLLRAPKNWEYVHSSSDSN